MKINYKKLIFCIVITFVIGGLFAMLTDNSFYKDLNKPFDLPAIVFPIVWSILYILMGTSLYLVTTSDDPNQKNAIYIYFAQLIVNSLWTLFFFGNRWFLFSFYWLIFLIILVILMIYTFYNINKKAALINIPYLIWLIFAAYLNYMIYYLN